MSHLCTAQILLILHNQFDKTISIKKAHKAFNLAGNLVVNRGKGIVNHMGIGRQSHHNAVKFPDIIRMPHRDSNRTQKY